MTRHPGGALVLERMCGVDGTNVFLRAHARSLIERRRGIGACVDTSAEAFDQQNWIDGGAAVAFLVVPVVIGAAVRRIGSVRLQDALFRQPLALPVKGRGQFLNAFLEMPRGVVLLLVLYLCTNVLLFSLWTAHFLKFQPRVYAVAAAAGRMAVYGISVSTLIGTRRFSWSWLCLRVPYERILGVHGVVGGLSLVFVAVHGFGFLVVFDWGRQIPQTAWLTGVVLGGLFLVFTPSVIRGVRTSWYSLFKVAHHFLVPLIVFLSALHLLWLNIDRRHHLRLTRGLYGSTALLCLSGVFWVFNLIWEVADALLAPVRVEGDPLVVPPEHEWGAPPYVCLLVSKQCAAWPGCWLSVTCLRAGVLSHPFTVVLNNCPWLEGSRPGRAMMSVFVKVSGKNSWTGRLKTAVEKMRRTEEGIGGAEQGRSLRECVREDRETEMRQEAKGGRDVAVEEETAFSCQGGICQRRRAAVSVSALSLGLALTGPYGGGLSVFGELSKVPAMIFIVGGCGATVAASMVPFLSAVPGRMTGVIWSFRSLGLFRQLRGYFSKVPSEFCHFYHSSAGGCVDSETGERRGGAVAWSVEEGRGRGEGETEEQIERDRETLGVQRGRPDIDFLLCNLQEAAERRGTTEVGVFVCGPISLSRRVQEVVLRQNGRGSKASHLHFHVESFQM
uniref:Ferric oxidoreductase domain-containing protein n=1 Tax=Chromera velia CCMP2878 TaxID=1169474 RepID=A0A0G4H8S5_9ALVE|eukprot:Cvel_5865.t1-p1 / transcript=Cvel_5865.t1 / gene=Cvel_5865 / organism=Chromera_velia_CCMP2878 / gene_product=hypothetical protein / transcript_product=hypothetical protein / location=Cvel_scaffold279:20771-23732(+) / protein_length=669 / sequence_SO=supercontig / SO=protein_coding / is_pseudo=false